jgi:hypothetical protein
MNPWLMAAAVVFMLIVAVLAWVALRDAYDRDAKGQINDLAYAA